MQRLCWSDEGVALKAFTRSESCFSLSPLFAFIANKLCRICSGTSIRTDFPATVNLGKEEEDEELNESSIFAAFTAALTNSLFSRKEE
tara:strand:+ start:1356 stop:1619 length:264 start_codon:yes stop_codon:yes gene_type:complete